MNFDTNLTCIVEFEYLTFTWDFFGWPDGHFEGQGSEDMKGFLYISFYEK